MKSTPKPLPYFPVDATGYRAFVQHIIEVEGVNFHPEDAFTSFTDKRGDAIYTSEEAGKRQRCHERFEQVIDHEAILTMALEVMLEFYRAGVKTLKLEGAYSL